MRTGKKTDLQKCLERSPLGSGNADEEDALVDVSPSLHNQCCLFQTTLIMNEETVDPVTDDFTIEELSDLSVELSLNLVRRKRNN